MQQKVTCYAKKQKDLELHEKKKWTDDNTEGTEILELLDKELVKATIKKPCFNKQWWIPLKQV